MYRVLYQALDIARHEKGVDLDALIAACLLHDIGRKEQFENPAMCHAKVGSEKAYAYLLSIGFAEEKTAHVTGIVNQDKTGGNHNYRSLKYNKNNERRVCAVRQS